MSPRLLLLHLSDIHFRKPYCLNPEIDRDRQVRTAIIKDAISICERIGNVNAILVTGDIAYHGDPEEYEVAKEWFDKISAATGCEPGNVYTVPGNHDINWKILEKNITTQALRQRILTINEPEKRYKEFYKILYDDKTAPELIEPLNPYNEFAVRYQCALSAPGKPFWIDEIPFNDSIKLRLYGLTSSLFCGPNDEKGRLYLGDIQTNFETSNDVINMALMHHPHDWFLDGDDVNDALWNNTKLQLLGHKHRQRIYPADNSVTLSAGAVNPARNENNWEPGYNFIELLLTEEREENVLIIKTHLRNWQSSPDRFIARQDIDGSDIFVKEMILGSSVTDVQKHKRDATSIEIADRNHVERDNMSTGSNKSLVYRFWDLASSQRREIANKLGLLSEKELELPEIERYKRAFKHAKDNDKVQELRDAIQNAKHKD